MCRNYLPGVNSDAYIGSQELLEAVERERSFRNTSRNATIFHHPTLGDFEFQHVSYLSFISFLSFSFLGIVLGFFKTLQGLDQMLTLQKKRKKKKRH